QNLVMQTDGDGDIEFSTLGAGGAIQLKGNVLLADGKTIRSSNGSAVNFSDGVQAGNLLLSGNIFSTANTNGDIEFSPNGNGDSYFSSGNVGIGNTGPSHKLDVTGTFRATGQATLSNYTANGGLLMTNTSGVVSQ